MTLNPTVSESTTPHASKPTAEPARDLASSWRAMLTDLSSEHGYVPLEIEGALPPELRGTLYRAGPAVFTPFGGRYGHWFDGDGAVTAVRFENGRAFGAVKLVQSEGLREERRAGKRLYSGYGTRTAARFREAVLGKRKNSANTSVLVWQGRLYALFEAARPTEVSPETLATLGESDLGGVVAETFSAHPRAVPSRNALYNFGIEYGKETALQLYELPAHGAARKLGEVPLSATTMIHDFIATENHLIFFAPPLRLRILPTLLRIGSYSENLRWKPSEGTEVIVVPIDDPSRVVRFTVDAFFQWHFCNAFERGDEIVVDLVRHADFATSNAWLLAVGQGIPAAGWPGRMSRMVLNPSQRTLREGDTVDLRCEFPQVSPAVATRPHRYSYVATHSRAALGRGQWDRLTRVDHERGETLEISVGEGRFPSELLFVPRAGATSETDGYLLTVVYDGATHRTCASVIDARAPEQGEIARAWFDHHIPLSFHGAWV